MEAHPEPVAGVTAISLHPGPTLTRAPNKRLAVAATSDDALPPHSKKRRKQSRPIRIPTPTSPLQLENHEEGEVEEGELQCSPFLRSGDTEERAMQMTLEVSPLTHEPSSGYSSTSVNSLLPSLLSFPPHFLLPMLPAASQHANPTPAAPPRIFNLEAYCELCSKEFCNKYFLKTHKANRHGIYVQSGDTPPSSTTPLPPPPAQSPTLQTPPTNKILPNKPAAEPAKFLSCDTCTKKFNNEHSLKRHKVKVHWGGSTEGSVCESNIGDEASRPPCSPASVHEPESANVESAVAAVEESAAHPTSPLSPGRLRRLGVINADAFCEICSKEYCNKYFLKTHKLKRHGIVVRDSDDNKMPCDIKLNSVRKLWEQGGVNIQTSPLNLTVHEQATCSNSSDSVGILRTEEPQKQEPSSPRPDSRDISEDLQKLQTMLLQLNALNGTTVSCENFSQHLEPNEQSDHQEAPTVENGGLDDSTPSSPQLKQESDYPSPSLVQHISEDHGTGTPTRLESDEGGNVPFSTSCYCDICNKELCNKYFKKVHMQKMHGIEIKDNALSGGVPCDICHKQLCSKYFVRVHKQNTHGIVDLSAPLPPSGRASAGSPLDALQQPAEAVGLKPTEAADLSHRYYTHFNVVCPLCSRRFRSAKWLKAHLINDHSETGVELARELEAKQPKSNKISDESESGSQSGVPGKAATESTSSVMLTSLLRSDGDRTNSYHCSYCSFTTPVLPLLFVHERSHTGLAAAAMPRAPFSCHLCFKSFGQNELLQRHLRTHQMAGLQISDDTVDEGTSRCASAAGRYRCAQCHQRFRTRDLWSAHMQSHSADEQKVPFSCPLCSFSTDTLSAFKKHVKQEHWLQEGNDDSRLWRSLAQVEVSRTLQDAARESHVPATYAVPQAPPDNFIMQPFLLEEPPESELPAVASCSEPEQSTAANTSADGTFVPSLVFLPVREKVSGTLTVSFTLTPA